MDNALKPAPPKLSVVSLTLTIDWAPYRLMTEDSPDGPAWKLLGGSDDYHVRATKHGPECDCPDFVFRREWRDSGGCKHIRALDAYGLLRRDRR